MWKRNKYYGGYAKLFEKVTYENPTTAIYAGQAPGQVDNGVTANTGSDQSTGYKVAKRITIIGTCGNAGDSLTLPKVTHVGFEYEIKNNGSNSADVFPPVGGNIDAAGANVATAVANTKSAKFILTSYTAADGTSTWAALFTD